MATAHSAPGGHVRPLFVPRTWPGLSLLPPPTAPRFLMLFACAALILPSAWGSPASISKKQTKCTPRFSSAARGLVCRTRDGPQHHKSYIDDEARETRQQVGPSEDVKPHRPPWRRNGLIPDGRHVTRKGQSGRRAACRPGLLVRIPCPGAVASQPVSQSSLPSTVSRLGLDTPELPETAPSASPSCSQHEERNDPSEPLPRPSGRRL